MDGRADPADFEEKRAEVDELHAWVGDPESVVDEHGDLPRNRRERSLLYFGVWRHNEVWRLPGHVADLRRRRGASEPKSKERSRLDVELVIAEARLSMLRDVPEPTSEQMCSECIYPFRWHKWSNCGEPAEMRPCGAWPRYAAHLRTVREMFFSAAAEPVSPKIETPKPLDIIPSGLPIDEVMERLGAERRKWPDAEVRRGARNRFEIWPPKG